MVGFLGASPAAAQAALKHRFLAVDNGGNKLLLVDQTGGKSWSVSIPAGSRDLQLLPGNKVLVSHGNGAAEYDLATGAKGWSITTYSNITTATRLDNGNTLLAGNVDGITLYEVAPDKAEKSKVNAKSLTDLRLARRLKNGNTLLGLAGGHKVVEIDPKGATVWSADLTDKAYVAYRLENGHTIATSGEDYIVYDIAQDGKATLRAGGKAKHGSARLLWFSGFEILPNGNVFVANWNGHGMEGKGPHAVEFDKDNNIVWSWEDHQAASTVTNVLTVDATGPSGLRERPKAVKAGNAAGRLFRGALDLLGRVQL
jgi:hypothetical protein